MYQSLKNWAHHNFGNKARIERFLHSLLSQHWLFEIVLLGGNEDVSAKASEDHIPLVQSVIWEGREVSVIY